MQGFGGFSQESTMDDRESSRQKHSKAEMVKRDHVSVGAYLSVQGTLTVDDISAQAATQR